MSYRLRRSATDDSDDVPDAEPPPAPAERRDAAPPQPPTKRVAGVDAYRGFVMLLMMAEVLHLAKVADALPDSEFWSFLAFHQTHVEWAGCSLHDLIQPGFSFLVGVAMPFSIAARRRRGKSTGSLWGHAVWRAIVLVLLGVFLRSLHRPQTYWTFEDTLSQIGLGYLPLFALGMAGRQWLNWTAFALIVAGYWAAFVLYPLPPEGFDFAAVGVPADWPHHRDGLAAHFNKNANLAIAFDQWFLNLFPREQPFEYHRGAYATLSFVPTLATMILGLIAGRWLRDDRLSPGGSMLRLIGFGLLFVLAGYTLDRYDIAPVVKRIWTSGWTVYSGGWCLLTLAAFTLVCDVVGLTAWAWPLRVIGANSIVAYVIAHLWEGFFATAFVTHFGENVFGFAGEAYEPLLAGAAVLLCYFAVLWWMYAKRIFVKI